MCVFLDACPDEGMEATNKTFQSLRELMDLQVRHLPEVCAQYFGFKSSVLFEPGTLGPLGGDHTPSMSPITFMVVNNWGEYCDSASFLVVENTPGWQCFGVSLVVHQREGMGL